MMKTQTYLVQLTGGPCAHYRADAMTLGNGVLTLYRGAVPVCSLPLDETVCVRADFTSPQVERGGQCDVIAFVVFRGEASLLIGDGRAIEQPVERADLEIQHTTYYPGGAAAVARAVMLGLIAALLTGCDREAAVFCGGAATGAALTIAVSLVLCAGIAAYDADHEHDKMDEGGGR